MDSIKTHCYATFDGKEAAERAMTALQGLQWPSQSFKRLEAKIGDMSAEEVIIQAYHTLFSLLSQVFPLSHGRTDVSRVTQTVQSSPAIKLRTFFSYLVGLALCVACWLYRAKQRRSPRGKLYPESVSSLARKRAERLCGRRPALPCESG